MKYLTQHFLNNLCTSTQLGDIIMAGYNDKDYDHLFKLLIVGSSAVGKSALLLRYAEGTYDGNYISTIGIDFKVRTINIDDQKVKLQIWDTAGQERFRTIGTAYYRNTHGVIVVYDVTSRESFTSVERWLREINQNCEGTVKIVLVGNKDDNPKLKTVQTDEALEFANKMGIQLFETSAKENINVEEMFYATAKLMVSNSIYKTLARRKKTDAKNIPSLKETRPRRKPFLQCNII